MLKKYTLFGLLFGTMMILLLSACFLNNDEFNTQPLTNNGKKWRIGYFEGGPFSGYPKTLIALIQGLTELGWLNEIQFPELDDITLTPKNCGFGFQEMLKVLI